VAKSRFVIRLEYLLARGILGLLRLVPVHRAHRWGAYFGLLLRWLALGQRRIVQRNLEIAFKDTLSSAEKKQIEKSAFCNMGSTMFEFMTMPRMTKEQLLKRLHFVGVEVMDRAIAKGRGVIAVTAHLGNWEMLGCGFAASGRPLAVIIRSLDNPLLDRYVEKFRMDKGVEVVPRGVALRAGIRALKRGAVLAFAMDQNSARNGIFIPFFGMEAATVRGPAQMSVRYDVPAVLCYDRREPDGSHSLIFTEEFPILKGGTEEESIRLNTEQYNRGLERIIRKNKDQWLWFHPRWRTRAEGEPSLY